MKSEDKGGDDARILFRIIVVERAYVVNEKGLASLDQDSIDRRFALAIPE